ncbi:glutamate racemase [Serpentinimonas raichei]|uniref:Glutamate racemase n=2 Tax=Serpentinimonas raichei TaxID=1458425 RepID=A0A060NH09_9BURK|nr:glutamate racemase [Serpentinimonas raichei]
MRATPALFGMSDAPQPIGVFDSGVGGLSVLREIRALLPSEELLYVADSGHAPYGDKPVPQVQARAERIIGFLLAQQVRAVVVACNTVTGLSIQALRQQFPQLPLVAIEPAVKPAVAATRSGTVGVLATHNTVRSPGLARLIAAHAGPVRVLAQACPGWVEMVERGELDGAASRAAVSACLEPLLAQGADVLVLGCTHYPFLRPLIEQRAGPGVLVLDPAAAVARELQRRLPRPAALTATATGTTHFWSSGDCAHAAGLIARLWGEPVRASALPV